MHKKILYLDLDGVLADFDFAVEQIQPQMRGMVDPERRELVHKLVGASPDFFMNLPLINGAEEAVFTLMPLFELYFLSTPMWDVPHSFSGKPIWLEKHFGPLVRKRLILSPRKDLQIGDFLVDDRKRHGSELFKGQFVHFGQYPFFTWKETLDYLKSQV